MRKFALERKTNESDIKVSIELDGRGASKIDTGLPFFDHMLAQISKHGGVDLDITAKGDLEVDAHHLVEDTGIVLGKAISEALGDRAGIDRFASISMVLDETLVEVALDISGRSFLFYEVDFPNYLLLGTPGFEPQLSEEFFRALVGSAGMTLHVHKVRGANSHHIIEAMMKGFGRTLKAAARIVDDRGIPSTKGVL